jgi:hypothetical protein
MKMRQMLVPIPVFMFIESFRWLKFLDSAAPIGLGHKNIAFGIDRQSVAMGKCTDLVTRTPEA